MDSNIDKECSALGGLFQQIINEMKTSSPIWEDFTNKATKLHSALKATIVATGAFLEAFQKVADMATNTKGATREMGSALTRLCMRHRSIENKLKAFSSAIMDVLVVPLQEKMEEWKKVVIQLDKDHSKEYKKARQEIKKASSDTLRLQKKVRKGKSDMKNRLDSALHDVNEKFLMLEETERNAVRTAFIEERSRFCLLVSCLKPVVDDEVAMLSEITHLQEIIDNLCMQAADPANLPPASEQVVLDIKSTDAQTWSYQTPPSSPSSLGSRKSSMCSISSMNSSSSGSLKSHHSPSHHYRHASQHPLASGTVRLSSISSQDSGFTSQDTLFLKPPTPPLADIDRKTSLVDGNSSSGTGTDSNATTPSPSYPIPPSSSMSTWSNWPDPPNMIRSDSSTIERPHTISTAYERSHNRPLLTSQTFEPPESGLARQVQTAPTTPNPYAVPCIIPSKKSTGRDRERDTKLADIKPPLPGPKPRSKPVAPPTVPDFNMPQADQSKETNVLPQPVYVNMNDLANMAVMKHQEHDEKRRWRDSSSSATSSSDTQTPDTDDDHTPTQQYPKPRRSSSMPPQTPNSMELAEAIKELEASTAALHAYETQASRASLPCSSGYGTMNSTPSCSEDTIASDEFDFPSVADFFIEAPDNNKFSTIPRNGDVSRSYKTLMTPRRPASTAGIPVVNSGLATIRRNSVQTAPKPSPPVRRTASITGGIPVMMHGMIPRSTAPVATPPRFSTPQVAPATKHHRRTFSDGAPAPPPKPLPDVQETLDMDDLPLPPPPDELLLPPPPEEYAPTSNGTDTVATYASRASISDSVAKNAPATRGRVGSTHASIIQSLTLKFSNMHPRPLEGPPMQPLVMPANRSSMESLSSDDVTPTGEYPQESLMGQIRRGIRLKRTVTNDRSGPRVG